MNTSVPAYSFDPTNSVLALLSYQQRISTTKWKRKHRLDLPSATDKDVCLFRLFFSIPFLWVFSANVDDSPSGEKRDTRVEYQSAHSMSDERRLMSTSKNRANPRQVERCLHDRGRRSNETARAHSSDVKVQRDAWPVSEDKSKSSFSIRCALQRPSAAFVLSLPESRDKTFQHCLFERERRKHQACQILAIQDISMNHLFVSFQRRIWHSNEMRHAFSHFRSDWNSTPDGRMFSISVIIIGACLHQCCCSISSTCWHQVCAMTRKVSTQVVWVAIDSFQIYRSLINVKRCVSFLSWRRSKSREKRGETTQWLNITQSTWIFTMCFALQNIGGESIRESALRSFRAVHLSLRQI